MFKSRFALRRDHLAYLLIALFGLAAAAVHPSQCHPWAINRRRTRFRAESHAATLAAANARAEPVQRYLPESPHHQPPAQRAHGGPPRHQPEPGQHQPPSRKSIITWPAMWRSRKFISCRSDLDADQIDPVTGAPQTPILMFASLLDDTGGGHVTRASRRKSTNIICCTIRCSGSSNMSQMPRPPTGSTCR